MHSEPRIVCVPTRHRLSLAALVLTLVVAACQGALPNPEQSPAARAEIAKSDAIFDAEPAVDAEPESETESSRPFRIEDLALDEPLQPVALAIDPTSEESWRDLEYMLQSPLWMQRAYPSEGRYPTPPGRAQQESFVMAFFISAALIATSPWTLERLTK